MAPAVDIRPLPTAGASPDCRNCPFYQGGSQFCPHERRLAGQEAPLFVIQGESPGAKEVAAGRPFVGPSGMLLDNELRKVGVNRAQGLVCNTVACRPPKLITESMWRKAIECCAPYLDSTLAGLRSIPCLALGDWSTWNRTGNSSITKWYGYPLPQKGAAPRVDAGYTDGTAPLTVMPCIHPAFVLREPAWLEEFSETLRRFGTMVNGTFVPWKEPELEYSEDTGRILTDLRSLRTAGSLGCDTETAGTDGLFVRLLCMSISDGDRSVCFDWPPAPEVLSEVRNRLMGGQCVVFHNRQHDTLVLAKAGIEMLNVQCTLNKHAALYPGLYHGLSVASVALEPAPRWKSEFHDEGSDHKGADVFTNADPVKRRRYCALDSYFGQRLDRRLSELLSQDVVSRQIYRELEEQADIALHMRRVGVKYNEAFRDQRLGVFDRRAARVGQIFDRLSATGRIPNVDLGKAGTTGSVTKLLLETFRLQPLEFTDSGKPSTGAWSLQMWGTGQGGADRFMQHVCRLLLRYRRATHAADMIRALTPSPDMRIHAPWNPWGALTGRWSCSKPNLMNLPKRGYYGMRQLCMADEGCCFVAADADKAEIRAVAYEAGDEPLLKAFAAGVDVHLANAVDLFGEKLLQKSKQEQESCRDLAKRLVYGFNYGAKPETVHHVLAPTHPELELKHIVYLQARWFLRHPAIKAYQYRLVEKARKDKMIRAPIGLRREFFPQGLVDPNKVYNFPAQSMIAEVIRRAQVILFKAGWDIRINCHDEIVLNVPVEKRKEAQAALEAAMTAAFELNGVTRQIPVESKIGYTWGDLMAPEEFDALLTKETSK